MHYLRLARPAQWIKSGFVFAPLVFSLRLFDAQALAQVAIAFAAFVCVSAAGYVMNDLRDAPFDRKHAAKKRRPIAAGDITARQAWSFVAVLLGAAAALASLLPPGCVLVLLGYLFLSILYSLKIKHVAIVDVMLIACGFVLRLKMGGYAAEVMVSPWIIQVTFLLSLFLGFGKRYHELSVGSAATRRALDGYSLPLLDKLITLCCGATLLSYAIYAVDMAERLARPSFVYGTLFVAFGLFRYLQHVQRDGGDAPEMLPLRDWLFLANLIAWLGFTLWQMGAVQ